MNLPLLTWYTLAPRMRDVAGCSSSHAAVLHAGIRTLYAGPTQTLGIGTR